MCHEYEPDELLDALRSNGPRLVSSYFRPEPDTDWLIEDSVRGNTFRGFAKQRPSEVFRTWARSRMTFSAVADLGEIATQEQMDELVERRFADLSAFWVAQAKCELAFGPGRKLVNLLHKALVRDTGVSEQGRLQVIPLLHVPHDKYCLAAVRLSAATGRYGPPMDIPPNTSMGFITSMDQYVAFQSILREIAQVAEVPPIAIDLLAWNASHGL